MSSENEIAANFFQNNSMTAAYIQQMSENIVENVDQQSHLRNAHVSSTTNNISENQWQDISSTSHNPNPAQNQSQNVSRSQSQNPSAFNCNSNQQYQYNPVSTSHNHSIFGTGNHHYKINNTWNIPPLSCYQRLPNSDNLFVNKNPLDQTFSIQHHQSNLQNKRYHINLYQGKSGNKDVCAEDKFKEDGDPWSVEAQAAFLGPILWDKTLPYDADLKVPQYEDLDEFLSENNMPDGLTGGHIANSVGFSHRSDSLGHSAALSLGLGHVTTKKERSPSPSDCISPDTLNPPSPAESTFSFASSGRDFDPRTRAFSDEELKPQPMIKKSRKQFVPDELKDDKYWARRRKNNIAAKRSRDARRQKENQIAMRARYLEKENATLHQEVEQLKQENMDLRSRLSKYQDV